MKATKYFMLFAFLFIISLPLAVTFLHIKIDFKNTENRALEKRPDFVFKAGAKSVPVKKQIADFYKKVIVYKDHYNNHYTDNFIFKPQLFKLFVAIKSGIFQTDPLPGKVLEGAQNWMFLGNDFSNSVLESTGLDTFPKRELDIMLSNRSGRQKWLANQGIKYFIAVAPNKETIYDNYFPIKTEGVKTKFEQIKKQASLTNINVIDLGEMLSNQSDTALFYKTDSHWNNLGAFWGYTKLMKELKVYYPNLNILQLNNFKIVTSSIYQNDLSNMLNIKRKDLFIALKNKAPVSTALPSRLKVPPHYRRNPNNYEKRYRTNVNNLKILIFRDSFGSAMIPYLQESFGESVFIWDYGFNKDLIEKEKPDIVIEQIAEREL